MRTFKKVIYVLAALLCVAFQSCESDEPVKMFDESVSVTDKVENNKEGMFAVNFVNPDGTPYMPDGLTKVTWGGSYSEYPYGTEVTTNWGTFCSKSGDQVTLSGGDGGSATLTGSGQSYTIASGIDKNYTISVTKTSAPEPETTYTITITIKATGIEMGKAAKVTFSASGCTPTHAVKPIFKSTSPGTYQTASFTATKGSNVSISVSCTNYGAEPSSFSYSNISSNQSDNLLINY